MQSSPRISLILCTRNRAASLDACLATVRAAVEAFEGAAEVIVVDNGSSDATPETLARWSAQAAFPLTVLTEPKAGVSRAKNRGIAAASGEILAFTDDDCRLAADYFTRLSASYVGVDGPCLIGGRVELGDPEDLPFTIKPDLDPQVYEPTIHPGGFAHGCNLSLSRSALDIIGGFDVRLGPGAPLGAAEDTDMVFRAYAAGVRVSYDPSFAVWHHHGRRDLDEIRDLHRAYNIGNGAIYVKHGPRNLELLRHVYWDLRGGLRERFGGALFNRELGLTHWGKVRGNLVGAWRMLRAGRDAA